MLCSMTFHEYKNGCLFRIWVVLGDVTREGIPRRVGRSSALALGGMRGLPRRARSTRRKCRFAGWAAWRQTGTMGMLHWPQRRSDAKGKCGGYRGGRGERGGNALKRTGEEGMSSWPQRRGDAKGNAGVARRTQRKFGTAWSLHQALAVLVNGCIHGLLNAS